jgi:hypothetical protein
MKIRPKYYCTTGISAFQKIIFAITIWSTEKWEPPFSLCFSYSCESPSYFSYFSQIYQLSLISKGGIQKATE